MIVTKESMARLNWKKAQGLIPAIAQDNITGQVLMMAWMNKEALKATLTTGKATFFSRSRKTLWRKGETSGNSLLVSEISADCDKDTLLMLVSPKGPACHLGTTSCWNEASLPSFIFLAKLESLLEARKKESPEKSYTSSLYAQGIKRIAQKVGEEGVETAIAAVSSDNEEINNEVADLLYHTLVLLKAKNISLSEVIMQLQQRHQKNQQERR